MDSARCEKLYRQNLRSAKRQNENLSADCISVLRELTRRYAISINTGELRFLNGAWYITHAGLLRIAARRRCKGIEVGVVASLSSPQTSTWVAKARVYTSPACKGFSGYGDASPSNVSAVVRGAELRIAETRAVNRALRKAYGIGICSVEELGNFSGHLPTATAKKTPWPQIDSSEPNGHHPLRDQLCLLVRQQRLDATLVKAYAADYCEVAELRLASRKQIADFIRHLKDYIHHDRDGLLCQLNSYARKPVGSSTTATDVDPSVSGEKKGSGAA